MNTNDKRIEVLQRGDALQFGRYRDAERYRKLRACMMRERLFAVREAADVLHGTYGIKLRGPTFDAAVDALPEPEEK